MVFYKCSIKLQTKLPQKNNSISPYIRFLILETMSKNKTYENEQIKVNWKPEVCIHAAECVKHAAEVFQPRSRPWVNLDKSSAEKVAAAIDLCPSGALSYELKNKSMDGEIKIEGEITEISVDHLRPTRIKGNFSIVDREGKVLLEGKKVASLCACGKTQKWPLCDGTHKTLPENQ